MILRTMIVKSLSLIPLPTLVPIVGQSCGTFRSSELTVDGSFGRQPGVEVYHYAIVSSFN